MPPQPIKRGQGIAGGSGIGLFSRQSCGLVPATGEEGATRFLREDRTWAVPAGGGGSVEWGSITGKPSTFDPSSHGHAIADVAGLQTALDGKQASGSYSLTSHNHSGVYALVAHSHAIADVTGLQAALDGKAASSHVHTIANVTGLQAALDGKQAAGSYASASHNHSGVYEPVIANGSPGQFLAHDKTWQTPAGGGGGDVWTRSKLASDFTNNTTTFNTVTGFSYTPPANSDFVIECELLVQTAATATLPRLGVNIGAGQQYGSVEMSYQSSANGNAFTNGQFQAGAANVQMAIGTAPTTNPYSAYALIKGRSGASPGAINIQLASESAGTVVTVKAGSEMRRRTI